jgi:phosphoglycolate phosphatase-like HAD superfamily hydrolase
LAGNTPDNTYFAGKTPYGNRLVLWNIDLTLLDVAQVTREACAEAFRQVTGRPLVRLPRMADRADSEVFFDALALNAEELAAGGSNSQHLLDGYTQALAEAFGARQALLSQKGRLLPGAREALTAVGKLPGVVQTVLTGSIQPNALAKLRAFGLATLVDTDIGGYGSAAYPRGTLLRVTRDRAAEARGVTFGEKATVYIGDSPRDVEAARIGGAWAIMGAGGRATHAELTAAGADAVFPDLTDTTALTRTVDELTLPSGQ